MLFCRLRFPTIAKYNNELQLKQQALHGVLTFEETTLIFIGSYNPSRTKNFIAAPSPSGSYQQPKSFSPPCPALTLQHKSLQITQVSFSRPLAALFIRSLHSTRRLLPCYAYLKSYVAIRSAPLPLPHSLHFAPRHFVHSFTKLYKAKASRSLRTKNFITAAKTHKT
jgi:hypothetical protein